jgi:hypothetical protein
MNREECAEGARELILAIFRLAVADYLGLSYGHDGPDRRRRISSGHRADAGRFLSGQWAAHLAGLAGLSGQRIWMKAQAVAQQAGGFPRASMPPAA